MTRAQFLNNLYRRLGGLSREQAEQHLTYYAEMLADRMEEGMTEEEAVASMEDVDTIAQRILQDEGVELPVTPPRAPDIPRVERVQVSAPEPVPEWDGRSWDVRKIVSAVLWAVAAVVVVWTLYGRFFAGGGDTSIDTTTEAVPSIAETSVVESSDTAAVQDTRIGGDDAVEEVTVYSYEAYHADGSYVVSALDIQEIEIDWVAGAVFIEAWDGEDLQFSENSTVSLDETTRLYYQVKGGKLSIRYSEKELRSFKGSKQLCLYVPQSLAGSLEELEVDTTSTDVYITRVDAGKLSLDTTSGSFIVEGNYGKVSADTTSGNVDLTGNIREVEFDSTSGSLTVMKNQQLVELDADTVSGDVGLSLPKDTGLTVTFDTVSGLLDSGGFTLTRTGSRYTCGNGACVINVDSVSGNVWLYSE